MTMTITGEHTEVFKPFSSEEEMVRWFMGWEKASRDTIDVKRCYVDLAGDLPTGVLLSQIIYWFLLSSEGKSKLSVNREGREWLAKGRRAWWDECRISEKQFDRAIKILRDKGLVETRLWKFGKRGTPTLHIYLNWPALVQGVNPILPKGQNGLYPKGKIDFDERLKSPKLNDAPLDYGHRLLTENTNIGEEEEALDAAAGVLHFFKQNFPKIEFTPVIEEKLRELINDSSPARVKEAISAAAEHRASAPIPYVRAVLEKEKEKNSAEAKFSPAPERWPNVRLTKEELLNLVDKFGSGDEPGCAEAWINALSLYKAAKAVDYESDYSAILSWQIRRNHDGSKRVPDPPGVHFKPEFLESLRPKPPQPGIYQRPAARVGNFVICGYIPGKGSRSFKGHLVPREIASAILGLPGKNGTFSYHGKCGGGIGIQEMTELYNALQGLRVEKSVFTQADEVEVIKRSQSLHQQPPVWVRPHFVAEIAHRGFTKKGRLFAPMFKQLRPELKPREVKGYE